MSQPKNKPTVADGFCSHGIALSVPCLKCQEFVRTNYPEYAPPENTTIQ